MNVGIIENNYEKLEISNIISIIAFEMSYDHVGKRDFWIVFHTPWCYDISAISGLR